MSVKTTNLFEVKDLFKSFQKSKVKIPVLRGVDLEVKEGETLAILGASGAGKSTLLHLMGTLDEPTKGKVFFRGKDLFALSEEKRCVFRNRHMGFVFQFHYLLPEFTALENVMLPGFIAGRSESELKRWAKDLLEQVGLGHRLSHRPSELSGGESQRVAVARALVLRPDVIFADEPTGNLDAENSLHLLDLLLEFHKTLGSALVVVTHDQNLASRLGRSLRMVDGQLC